MDIRDHAPLLNVRDVGASVAFYRDRLGFALVEDAELEGQVIWAALHSGRAKLMLNQAPEAPNGERAARPSYSDLVLYLYVEDAQQAHAELSAAGVEVGELEQEEYGLLEFYLRDPDGYEIGIGSPLPPWCRDEEEDGA